MKKTKGREYGYNETDKEKSTEDALLGSETK
jgi:hypothetical protein